MPDPEIEAMGTVAGALADLDEAARERVLRWAASRYEVQVKIGGIGNPEKTNENRNDSGDGGSHGASYEHFAELFDAASPASNADKALVAAYWVQAEQGNEQWSSSALNSQLKNLGHSIANITAALDANMATQRKRVIQLKKSGSSQQARKTYKVTTEGIKYVQKMIAGDG